MFEIKSVSQDNLRIVKMVDMEPLQIGRVVSKCTSYKHIVMRTACENYIEIIDMSDPNPDGCWDQDSILEVELLPSGTEITLKVVED